MDVGRPLNQPIVLDNGSGTLKAGFAGQDLPQLVMPAMVGRPKHVKAMSGAVEGDSGDHFIGKRADEHRGLLELKYPIENGIVEDWEDMERVWGHVFANELKVHSEEHPVLLTEAPLNPRKNREKVAEMMFETFNVPSLFISIQSVLALYASGRTTGVVLDSGDGVTHAVPVYEGFALPHSIVRLDFAGRNITRHMTRLLRRAGHRFHTTAEHEIVRGMKEHACYLALQALGKEEEQHPKPIQYRLPDGSVIGLGSERFWAPEALFHPSLMGEESMGIHEAVTTAIRKSDMDLRRTMYENIILAGGTTLFRGFGDRLLNEVKSLAPKDIKIRIHAPPERRFTPWIGGSVVAGLASFKMMCVDASEWADEGTTVLHRKCFL